MDGAVKKRKQSIMKLSPDNNMLMGIGTRRGLDAMGLPTAEEALAKYYKRMSKLEKKLNQKLED